METTFNYKEINFRFRRSGWFGVLLFVLIGLLIAFVCTIECYLFPIHDGLTPELGLIVPIFYGILALAVAMCWCFIIINNAVMLNRNINDIRTTDNLYWITWCCFFVPMIFGFIGSKVAYNRHIGKPKKQWFKKRHTFINPNPMNTAYEYNGAWYYYDENNNYYTVSDGAWVACENPHLK